MLLDWLESTPMRRFCLTVLLVASCLVPAQAQTPEQKTATIAYIRSLQTESGGFLASRPTAPEGEPSQPSLRATSGALRALKYFGGEPSDRNKCRDFVAS